MAERLESGRTLLRSKLVQSTLLALVLVAMLGASASRYDRLGHKMICTCSCNQILMECNHVGCPVSPVMLAELQTQIDTGGPDTAILNWFVAKYGAVVLAAPIRGGFDDVAWITPLAVFFLATIGTGAVIWYWRQRTSRPAHATAGLAGSDAGSYTADPTTESLRERIRRETEYR